MASNLISRGLTLRVALLLLTLLLGAGCGDSNGDFVFTGTDNGGNVPQTGSVTLNFVRAQTALQVPQSTTRIQVEFYDGPNGTGSPSRPVVVRDFSPSITITGVPVSTRSLVITPLTSEGVPLLESVVNVNVTVGGNSIVDFSLSTTELITATALTLTPAEVTIAPGTTRPYTATVTYSNGATVDNPTGVQFTASGAATIDATTGVATAGGQNGTATITATVGGVSGAATLNISGAAVTPVLTTLLVNPDGATVAVGQVLQFRVTGADQNGRPMSVPAGGVTWTSSNPASVTINPTTGVANGVAEGTTTINASVGGVSDNASLNVVRATVDQIVSVSPSPVLLRLNTGNGADAMATLTTIGSFQDDQGVPDRQLTSADGLLYTSASPSVATVDNEGRVSAIAPGSTTITASAGSVSRVVEVIVTTTGGGGVVPNTPPVLLLDPLSQGQLVIPRGGSALAFSQATVTDDQANLNGGTLTVNATNTTATLVLHAPLSPSIGTVSGNATTTLTVNLNTSATPAAIQSFMRGVTANATSTSAIAVGTFQASLTDAGIPPGTGSNSRSFSVALAAPIGRSEIVLAAGQTQAVITVTSPTRPGDTIFVMMGGVGSFVSSLNFRVADSAGNDYSPFLPSDQLNGVDSRGADSHVYGLYRCFNTTPLAVNNTITLNFPSAAASDDVIALVAFRIPGLTVRDTNGSIEAQRATDSPGFSTFASQPHSYVIGGFSAYSTTRATPPPTFTPNAPYVVPISASVDSGERSVALFPLVQLTPSSGFQHISGTFSTPSTWDGGGSTYR